MTTIRTRAAKGSALSATEYDDAVKRTPVAKSSNYILDASHNREVHELGGSITTVTLPVVSSSFTETDDWSVVLVNTLGTPIIIARNGNTIDNIGTDLTLNAYERIIIWMNSTFDGFWTNKPGGITGSFTGTLTGCTTSPTGICNYIIVGRMAMIYFPSITGISNTANATITGLPNALTPPTRVQNVPARILNNSLASQYGYVSISGTTATLFPDSAGSAFVSSGYKGILACTVSYLLV